MNLQTFLEQSATPALVDAVHAATAWATNGRARHSARGLRRTLERWLAEFHDPETIPDSPAHHRRV